MSDKQHHQLNRRYVLKSIATGALVAMSFKAVALSSDNTKKVSKKTNVTFIISFEAKAKRVADFIKILESVKTDLPKVKGCISVDIFKSSSANNKFTLVETWDTEESHKINISNLSKDGTWDIIASHLSKDPESGYFIPL